MTALRFVTCSIRNRSHELTLSEDVKTFALDVLRHRIILTYEAEARSVAADAIVKKVFNVVPVP